MIDANPTDNSPRTARQHPATKSPPPPACGRPPGKLIAVTCSSRRASHPECRPAFAKPHHHTPRTLPRKNKANPATLIFHGLKIHNSPLSLSSLSSLTFRSPQAPLVTGSIGPRYVSPAGKATKSLAGCVYSRGCRCFFKGRWLRCGKISPPPSKKAFATDIDTAASNGRKGSNNLVWKGTYDHPGNEANHA